MHSAENCFLLNAAVWSLQYFNSNLILKLWLQRKLNGLSKRLHFFCKNENTHKYFTNRIIKQTSSSFISCIIIPNHTASFLCNRRTNSLSTFVSSHLSTSIWVWRWGILGISDYTVWPKDGNVAVLNSKWAFYWLAPHRRLATAFLCSTLLFKRAQKCVILTGYNCTEVQD